MTRTILTTALATTLSTMPVMLLAGVAVFVRAELDFDESQLGLAVSTFFLASAVASMAGGRLAPRIGARRGILLGTSGSTLALLATTGARSLPQLLVTLVMAGMANGLTQPACNLALARGVDAARQGLAFGLKQAAVPFGGMLGGLAVPAVAQTVGWRWAYAIAACGVFVVMALVPPSLSEVVTETRLSGRWADRGVLVVLAIAFAFATSAMTSLQSFAVESAVAAGLRAAAAGVLLFAASLTALVSRMWAGWRADRRGARHLPTVATYLACGAAGLLALATLAEPLVVAGSLLGFAGFGWSGLALFAVVRIRPDAPAAATSYMLTGSLVGAVVGPLLFGLLVTRTGYTGAWLAAAIWAGLAALLMLTAREMVLRGRSAEVTLEAAG